MYLIVLFSIIGMLILLDSTVDALNLNIERYPYRHKTIARMVIRGAFYLLAFFWLFWDVTNIYMQIAPTVILLLLAFMATVYGDKAFNLKRILFTLKQTSQQILLWGIALFTMVFFYFIMNPILLVLLFWVFIVGFYVLFPKIAATILKKKFRLVPYRHHMDAALFESLGLSKKVYMVDAKKISIGLNAMVLGLGTKAHLLMSRRLLATMTSASTEGVIAHELGHIQKKHLYKRVTAVLIGLHILLIANIFVTQYFFDQAMLVEHIVSLGFMNFIFIRLAQFVIIRQMHKHEFEADHVAKKLGYGLTLRDALKKLKTFTDDDFFHSLYAKWYRTHPPIKQRMAVLKQENL